MHSEPPALALPPQSRNPPDHHLRPRQDEEGVPVEWGQPVVLGEVDGRALSMQAVDYNYPPLLGSVRIRLYRR